MKALFLSITAGDGHHAACKAVMSSLAPLGVECHLLDTYRYISPLLSVSIDKGYVGLAKFSPELYGHIYDAAYYQEKAFERDGESFIKIFNSMISTKLLKFIKKFQPDVVVCSHIYTAQIATALKEKGLLNVPAFAIVTDYTIHPFWRETNVDYLVTPTELMDYAFLSAGFDKSTILPMGIPVDPKFSIIKDKKEMRKKLGWKDKPTVLLMGGSMGYGDVLGYIHHLDKMVADFQMVVICGNNKRMLGRIEKIKHEHNILGYGYVQNVDEMMDAADCLVTKPGALTTCEAMAKQLPIIMTQPIPGQEEYNFAFLMNHGMAMGVSSRYTLEEAVYRMLFYPQCREQMQAAQGRFGKPQAAQDLADKIISCCT